jgi:formylglycine-generating enzyme required for sulfatase activity
MVSIPPGSFKRDGIASHITSITQGFIMSRFLVTQGLFAEIMGVNPSHFQDKSLNASHPVEQVNWYHAIAFANKLSLAEGLVPVYTITSIDDWEALTFEQIPTENSSDWNQVVLNWNVNGYRLPTEAEWV